MSKKQNNFGFWVLVGVCVVAVAFLTGCSSGDNGSSRGNGNDNGEGPPSEDVEGLPESGPGTEPPDQPPE